MCDISKIRNSVNPNLIISRNDKSPWVLFFICRYDRELLRMTFGFQMLQTDISTLHKQIMHLGEEIVLIMNRYGLINFPFVFSYDLSG